MAKKDTQNLMALHGLLSAVFGKQSVVNSDAEAVEMLEDNAHLFSVTRNMDPESFDWLMRHITDVTALDDWRPGISMPLNKLLMMPKSTDLTSAILDNINIDSLNRTMMSQSEYNLSTYNENYKIPDLTADLGEITDLLLNLKPHNELILDFYEAWMLTNDYRPSERTLKDLSILQVSPDRLIRFLGTLKAELGEEYALTVATKMIHANLNFAGNFSDHWRSKFKRQLNIADRTCEALWAFAQYENARDKINTLLDIDGLDINVSLEFTAPASAFFLRLSGDMTIGSDNLHVLSYLALRSMIDHVEYAPKALDTVAFDSHDIDATLALTQTCEAEKDRLEHDLIVVRRIDPFSELLNEPIRDSLINLMTKKLDGNDKAEKELQIFKMFNSSLNQAAESHNEDNESNDLKSFSI